jgi:hypothetical protein
VRATLKNASIRQLVLALVFIGIVGLEAELALLKHAESASQWIPHVVLMIGLVSTVLVFLRPDRPVLRAFQTVMLIFVIVGVVGLYLHYRGNVEFAIERDPSLSGLRLVWKALRGATPALAPGALSQVGLLGLIYSYRHPALTEDKVGGAHLG